MMIDIFRSISEDWPTTLTSIKKILLVGHGTAVYVAGLGAKVWDTYGSGIWTYSTHFQHDVAEHSKPGETVNVVIIESVSRIRYLSAWSSQVIADDTITKLGWSWFVISCIWVDSDIRGSVSIENFRRSRPRYHACQHQNSTLINGQNTSEMVTKYLQKIPRPESTSCSPHTLKPTSNPQ